MLYAGFDIGGTKCAFVLGEGDGGQIAILKRRAIATRGWRETLAALFEAARAELAGAAPAAIGVSCGGPLDQARGVILSPPNLPGWDEVNVTEMAADALGAPAFLENDANACALAEWRWGAGRGADNMAFLTFGTGLGAGLILGGRLYRGANGNAGEIGHMRLAPFGPAGYGKAGAFEGFCSGGGIAQLAATLGRAAAQRGAPPAYFKGNWENITAKDVAEAALDGDATAAEAFRLSGEKLGEGLALVNDVLNLDVIVIGSIYARCVALLKPPMTEALRREALPGALAALSVRPALLGERIGDYAALVIAALNAREA